MIKFLKSPKVILFVILVFGFLIRLYKITNPIADWHSFRQADTASVSKMYFENGINLLLPKYHDVSRVQSGKFNPEGYRFVEFPIYNAIHALVAKFYTPISLEMWGRLLSILITLGTSIFIYLTGKKIYNVSFGIISAAVFLFIPYNIYFTRVILPDPLAVFFGVSSIYFFLKYTDKEEKINLFVFALLMSFGLLVKPYVIFYGLVPAYWLIKTGGIKKSIKNPYLILSSIIILAPLLAWRVWMAKFPEGIPFYIWTFNGNGIRFRPAFFRWIFGERLGYLILGTWGLVPFSWGIMRLQKKDWFLISSLLASIAYVTTFATANVRHDYYQIYIIPSVSFALAFGIQKMWENMDKILTKILLIFSLLIAFLVSWSQVREFYKINHPEIIDAGKAVERLTPKDALVIAAYNGDTAFLYQTGRRGWPVVELPINELIDEGARYYTSVNLNDTQTIEFINKFKVLEKTNSYVVLDLTQKQ